MISTVATTAAAIRMHLAVATVAHGFDQEDAALVAEGYERFDRAVAEALAAFHGTP